MKTPRLLSSAALCAAALFGLSRPAPAQQILIPEDHSWNFLHPMGVLPPRADTTPDPDFDTTWFLAAAQFGTTYDGPSFNAATIGDPFVQNSADSGPGLAPFAYGGVDAIISPNTLLSTPDSTFRYASYYRTTFTVPAGGLIEPTFRMVCDDGCYVYLDGALIATVNIADGVADTYTSLAADATNTELEFAFHLRNTGLQPGGSPGDVRILTAVPSLTAGSHTLAVSVHNNAATSSDMGLLLELSALPPATTTIHAVASDAVRDFKGTPLDASDDEFSFKVTVTGNNTGATWSSDNPVRTGAYGVPVTMGPYPAGFPAFVTFTTAASPSAQTSITVDAPSAFATLVNYNHVWKAMNPLAGTLPPGPAGPDTDFETTWFLKENSFLTQYNGPNFGANGVAGSYQAITGPGPFAVGGIDGIAAGQPVGAVGTTMTLPASGNRLTSYYRTTFTTTQPMSLVTFDLLCDDGVYIYLDGNLVAQENMLNPPAFTALAAAARDENLITVIDMSVPPDGLNVIATVPGLAPGEHTLAVSLHQSSATSSDFGLALKMSGIEVAGQAIIEASVSSITRSEAGTPQDPSDDTFSFIVTVNGANAGTTWNSNSTPSSGTFGTPATFGPFPVIQGNRTIQFSASANPSTTATVTVAPPAGAISSAVVSGLTRDGNGTPADPRDDTISFDVTVTGVYVGNSWTSSVSPPSSGPYNQTVRFGPFPATAPLAVTLTDSADFNLTRTFTVQPPRYIPPVELVPYSQTWQVMNPLSGFIPDGPSGFDEDFESTWFLAEPAFALQYNGPSFGSGGVPAVHQAVQGPGPFAVGGIDGLAAGTTIGPVGTALSLPATGNRFTSYYRTTFTSSQTVSRLKIDLLCDDGVFIYLDGNLIAQENMPSSDGFTELASGARNENLISTIDLTEPPGTNVLTTVSSLAPGTHTLAVSLHQSAAESSDFGLALTLYGAVPAPEEIDTDGDGQSDPAEALAGTDPNNPLDYLRITTIIPSGAGVTVAFPSKSGKNYRLEASNRLTSGWAALGGVLAGTGGDITADLPQFPIPGESRYYLRVRVVP